MKACITDYLLEASQNNTDIFFDIVEHKYRKFISLYWVLKDYSDDISSFEYNDQPVKEKLSVSIKIGAKPKKKLIQDITGVFGDCALTRETNKKLEIEIDREEVG